MKRRIGVLLLAVIMTCSAGGCYGRGPQTEPISESRFLLDTVCTISILGTQDRTLLSEAFNLCAEYEKMLSITVEGSDVWRINHAGGTPVTVAPETIELLRLGIFFAELSGGIFDITVGRLSTLWDYSGKSGVPSGADLTFALGTVDFRGILIEGNTVQLENPETWIDLGGVAKGYIADRLSDFLRGRGVPGAVIDLGGDISIVGKKPDGSPWRIGVRQPFGEVSDLLGAVSLGESSIVSSGIYERKFEENGIIYHHILDTGTGMPARSDVISATVVTESTVIGDIVSTIVIIAGSGAAAKLLDQTPGFIGALLVLDSGELLQYGELDFDAF